MRNLSLALILLTVTSLFFAGTALAAQAAADPQLLQSRDIFSLETASDVQISPDGRQVVYVRGTYDIMTDKPRANLWIVDTNGTNHRPLRSDANNHRSPRWSPDGSRIVFISDAEGKPQLFVRWMDTGQTALLTNLSESPADLTWSPDGKLLAFTQFVPGDKPSLAKPPEKPEGANWAPPVTVIDDVVYRVDGQGYLKSGYSQVFLVSAEGGAPRQLTRGAFNHRGGLAFTPDGKRLLLSANRRDDWQLNPADSDIHAIDLDTLVMTQLTRRDGPDVSPLVAPNGKTIAYLGFDDRRLGHQISRLYIMNADGSNARAVSQTFEFDIEDPVWAENGLSLYFVYDDAGIRRVGNISHDGKIREIARQVGSADIGRPYTGGGFSVARNGRVAFVRNSTASPGDVAVTDARGKGVRTLTTLNADLLGHKTLGQVARLTWQSSADQREIEGWLVTPPQFDASRRYPLILEIHGGPFTAYGPNFSVEIQRYAAAGYMVLYANPRGSTSYGEDFANLIHHAYPGNDYDDLMSGVDAIIARGNVDPEQLYVTGGSGGGVLTAWIVGKTDRFRAAVVAKPVINWTSFALTADMNNFFYRYWFSAPPWEAQDEYWRRSPLSLVGNVKTPTMLLTGEADFRTPIGESEQFYQALKLRDVPTLMVRLPQASHGMTGRPSQFIAKIDNILAWFERYRGVPAAQAN